VVFIYFLLISHDMKDKQYVFPLLCRAGGVGAFLLARYTSLVLARVGRGSTQDVAREETFFYVTMVTSDANDIASGDHETGTRK
jgi:hypothetical protein